ncbi:MAG TPA: PHB depolymerase family esterase [Gemmatimonadota bacterium]|nr:PHB depolymerase family esterase [Gemmatimonadota bacterium]
MGKGWKCLPVAVSVMILPASSVAQQLAPGDHTITLQHLGRERLYLVHIPPDTLRPLPVVLSLHGGGGHARGHAEHVRFEPLADSVGFIVVTPNGTGPWRWRLLTWNAGTCCGYAQSQEVNDVDFVRALLDDLATRTRVDESRIYATGFSNGGMMTYRLAEEAADRIAAFAPVGGVVLNDSIEVDRPVPLLHIHSVDDPRALYAGGLGPPFPLTNVQVEHVPVEDVLAQWAAHNGCSGAPRTMEVRRGEPGTLSARHRATRLVYSPCAGDGEITFWKLGGAGHVWPGAAQSLPVRLVGEPTHVIDANRVIWEFFQRHSLPSAERGARPR